MKKLLVLLLCVPLMFSCGENEEKNDINELKINNNKYEFYPSENKGSWRGSDTYRIYKGDILNKETGELWSVKSGLGGHVGFKAKNQIRKEVSKEDLE